MKILIRWLRRFYNSKEELEFLNGYEAMTSRHVAKWDQITKNIFKCCGDHYQYHCRFLEELHLIASESNKFLRLNAFKTFIEKRKDEWFRHGVATRTITCLDGSKFMLSTFDGHAQVSACEFAIESVRSLSAIYDSESHPGLSEAAFANQNSFTQFDRKFPTVL